MSRIGQWFRRLFRRRRRRHGGSPPDTSPPQIIPPVPLYGKLEFSIDQYSVIDTQANFVTAFVNRTEGEDKIVTVNFHTVPGTATPGVDYTPVAGTLTWFDQDVSPKGFSIPILQRSVSGDFTFDVVIDTPGGGATIIPGGDISTVTIERRGFGEADFAGPVWYVKNPDPNPATSITLYVQRNFAFKGLVTVNWHTQDGTAIAGLDYTAGSGMLTWASGDGSPKSIIIGIPPRPGGPFPDRDFFVILDTPTGGIVIGPINPADVTVTDAAPPANPTVSASIPNQIVDDESTESTEQLCGDEGALQNQGILVNDYSGLNNVDRAVLGDLFGVAIAFNQTNGAIAGDAGTTLFSPAQGVVWVVADSGVVVRLRSVCYGNANHTNTVAIAVGDGGTILKSVDGGQTWVAKPSGTVQNLRSVWAADATTVFAVGENGTILKSVDNGETWAALVSGVGTHLNGVSFAPSDPNNGWVVGDGGVILRTANGTNWVAQVSGTGQNLHDIWMIDAANGWLVGDAGTLLHTANGGALWTAQVSGTAQDLHGISMFNGLVGMACGGNGVIIRTTDGVNWTTLTTGTTETLNDIDYAEGTGDSWVAVGANGTILNTYNRGAVWQAGGAVSIGTPSGTGNFNGGTDFTNIDDTFSPTSRFAMSGMIS
jgi:photosystem II stability/assembly factor-like uncharacterized protein